MYLDKIINNNKLSLEDKIHHFELAVKQNYSIPRETWKKVLKKYPKFLTKEFTPRFQKKDSGWSFRRKERLINILIYSRSYHRKSKKYDISIQSILEFGNVNWTRIEYRYWVEEILYSGHTNNAILVLDKFKDLNRTFNNTNRYKVPATTNRSVKFFKYLKDRKYNFKRNRVEDIQWLCNYIKAGCPIKENIILGFFDRISSYELDADKKKFNYCFEKIIDNINDKIIKKMDLITIDRIIIENKNVKLSKRRVAKMVSLRNRLFNLADKDSAVGMLDQNIFYSNYYNEQEMKIALNGFDVSCLFNNDAIIKKLNKKLFIKKENYKIYKPDGRISLMYYYKTKLDKIDESKLFSLKDTTDKGWNIIRGNMDEIDVLKEYYSQETVFNLIKNQKKENNIRETYQEIIRAKEKYKYETEIRLPKFPRDLEQIEEGLKFINDRKDEFAYTNRVEKVLNNREYKDIKFKILGKNYASTLVYLGVDLNKYEEAGGRYSGRDGVNSLLLEKDGDVVAFVMFNEEDVLLFQPLNKDYYFDINLEEIKGFYDC